MKYKDNKGNTRRPSIMQKSEEERPTRRTRELHGEQGRYKEKKGNTRRRTR